MAENELNNSGLVLDNWAQDGVKTPFTDSTTQKSLYETIDMIENQPYSNLDTFKNAAELMWEDTTLGVMQRHSDIVKARQVRDAEGNIIHNPMLSREEANIRYKDYGVTFNNDIRQNEAELIVSKKITENALRERLSQSEGSFMSGASSLLGGLAGAMLDPVNIATAFIPVTKLVPALKGLEAAGFWGRTALKGIDGMVMNSFVEPLPLWMAGVDQRDYTMADTLFNTVAGGVFGAGIGAFTEGVRALAKGEKFNSGVAAAIDYANNRGLDTITEFQKKNPAITSLAYDDLVELPVNKLSIIQEDNLISVRLNETGPLSSIIGYGRDLDSAKRNLRERIGAVLDDDNIFSGYRIDDVVDNFYKALENSGHLTEPDWLPKWLNTLQKKALDKGLSFEEYIAKQSKNFTDFESLVKRAEQSKVMQLRFGELSGDALDEAIEQGAELIDAYAKLKEAFINNPKQKMDYNTFIGNLREKVAKGQEIESRVKEAEEKVAESKNKQIALQKQLDIAEVTADSKNLVKQINDLNASIRAIENELNNFRSESIDNLWKHDIDSIELLEAMRAKLTEDPRTFDDVKEQLQKQVSDESGKTWDTSDSILDNMTVEEISIADDAKVAKLLEEIAIDTEDIKAALKANKFSKEEILALGIDNNGQSVEMRRADKRIEAMDKFSQAADDYAACRSTEVL